jgi:malate dehydrogenase (oxaloacetate-decarboxylating)
LATTIGGIGANIGNIQTVSINQNFVLRDIDVFVEDEEHLRDLLQAVSEIPGVRVVETRDEVMDLHKGGKIATVSRYPVDSIAMLRKVYTPGVAEVCRAIVHDPDLGKRFTSIGNTVAIITDGTAVLGLGSIGLVPAMPVMEGKAALLHQFVGVNGVPLLLDVAGIDDLVESVLRVASTFSGIHLEDIASPACFEIVEKLRARLDIPVMQDDQDGTAAVVLGALMSATRNLGRGLADVTVGQIGLGAAGQSIAGLLMHATGRQILGVDLDEDSLVRHESLGGIRSTFQEVMEKADVVIATTGIQGLIPQSAVREGQIIFALSNPDPEITPTDALHAGAAIAADGTSVNNVLGYPGIWRGALSTRATEINREMLIAAAKAVQEATRLGELNPSPLDLSVHRSVAFAVGKAAVDSGVGQADGLEELEV